MKPALITKLRMPLSDVFSTWPTSPDYETCGFLANHASYPFASINRGSDGPVRAWALAEQATPTVEPRETGLTIVAFLPFRLLQAVAGELELRRHEMLGNILIFTSITTAGIICFFAVFYRLMRGWNDAPNSKAFATRSLTGSLPNVPSFEI